MLYNLNSTFDSRDGITNTLNSVKLNATEKEQGYLLVNYREVIADFGPNNSTSVSKCWGRVLDSANNAVVCASSQVYCAWSSGRAYLRGQDPTYVAGGCRLPPNKTYKAEVFLQNSSSQTLQACQSANFIVTE